MKKIYFAAPLFSQADFHYNALLVDQIRQAYPEYEVFLPQEQGEINDKNKYADSKMIAKLDADAVLESDLIIALLDGVSIDAGVASEVGIAYQADIPMLGLFTDSRQLGATNQDKLDALQVVGLIKMKGQLVSTAQDLIKVIPDLLKD